MKKCNKCNLDKEFSMYYKRHTNKDGYRNICKECEKDSKNKSDKKYYETNRDLLLEKSKIISRKWRKKNSKHTKEWISKLKSQKK